ncbi:MAG TPA: ABC transporter permease [Polyangiaceae bacterium]|nr:ABC transporter permease [Polyangiaceae bacterium]
MHQRVSPSPNAEAFPSKRVFWGWWGGALVALPLLAGAVTAVQSAHGLAKFGGLEYAPRVCALSVVREIAPASGTGAAVIAAVAWAHRVGTNSAASHLRSLYARFAVVSVGAFPFAAFVATVSSASVLAWHGISVVASWALAANVVAMSDVAAGLLLSALHALVALGLTRVGLIRLTRSSWGLGRKLSVAWAALIGINTLFGAVGSLFT